MIGSFARRETGSESTAEPLTSLKAKKLTSSDIRAKYQPLDSETTTLLYGLVSRLGQSVEDNGYILSVDFDESLDDLTRLLGADEGQIIAKLGEMQIVGRHLVPMLSVMNRTRFEGELFMLLNILLLFTSNETMANRVPHQVLLDYRRQSKRHFESEKVLQSLLDLCLSCITLEQREKDVELMGKIFTLLRNLLAIPDCSASYQSANVALSSTFGRQERLIHGLQKTRLMEFLIVAAGSCNDRRDGRLFGPHVSLLIEIFHCLLKAADPDTISAMYSYEDGGPQRDHLENFVQAEPKLRKPIRHSRFSGSVVVRLSFLQEGLGELVRHFNSNQEKQSSDTLEWNLLGVCSWCLRFSRTILVEKRYEFVSFASIAPLIEAAFLTQLGRSLRRYMNERNDGLLQASLLFFREALRLLDLMQQTEVKREEAKMVLAEFFYHHDVLVIFRLVLQNYHQRLPDRMLAVLVEANHVLLKLLKTYCEHKGHVFVSTTRPAAEEGEAEAMASEHEFFFEQLLSEYANEAIINALLRLLRDAPHLEANTNRFVATMIVRLAYDLKLSFLFYRVTILDALHQVLLTKDPLWRSKNSDLLKVAHSIGQLFVRELVKDPTLIVSAFFNPIVSTRMSTRREQLAGSIGGEPLEDLEITEMPASWDAAERIIWLVRTLIEGERSSALAWLVGLLFDAAATRSNRMNVDDVEALSQEEEDAQIQEPFYLHAHTDTVKLAFAEPSFRALLLEAGAVKPDHVDPSWRIPSHLPSQEIIEKAQAIQTALRAILEEEQQDDSSNALLRPVNKISKQDDDATDDDASSSVESYEDEASEDHGSSSSIEAHDDKDEENKPVTLVASRWSSLKRNNFFLSHPVAPPKEEPSSDNDSESITEMPIKSKRPPLVIDSDNEG